VLTVNRLRNPKTESQNPFSVIIHSKIEPVKIPEALISAKKYVYDKSLFTFSDLITEAESAEYGACRFCLSEQKIIFRVAKITPTKTGQFVTVWQRNNEGITAPFDASDDFDFIVISTKKDNLWGQFIFSKAILLEKDVVSNKNMGGKRGFRVYPPWDIVKNKQAEKSQKWQVNYFLDLSNESEIDFKRVKSLFNP
jgi:hypothetical protein